MVKFSKFFKKISKKKKTKQKNKADDADTMKKRKSEIQDASKNKKIMKTMTKTREHAEGTQAIKKPSYTLSFDFELDKAALTEIATSCLKPPQEGGIRFHVDNLEIQEGESSLSEARVSIKSAETVNLSFDELEHPVSYDRFLNQYLASLEEIYSKKKIKKSEMSDFFPIFDSQINVPKISNKHKFSGDDSDIDKMDESVVKKIETTPHERSGISLPTISSQIQSEVKEEVESKLIQLDHCCEQCMKFIEQESLKNVCTREDIIKMSDSKNVINLDQDFGKLTKIVKPAKDDKISSVQKCILYFHQFVPSSYLKFYLSKVPDSKLIFLYNFLNYYDDIKIPPNMEPLEIYRSYTFNINKPFYIYLRNCNIPLELFLLTDRRLRLLGSCTINFRKPLKFINTVFEANLEVNNNLIKICYPFVERKNFGTLMLRYVLRGTQEAYDMYKLPPKLPTSFYFMGNGKAGSFHSLKGDLKEKRQSVREIDKDQCKINSADLEVFKDGLNLILMRNKALMTTQLEIFIELKQRVNWMHEELKWRLTLQENAILSGKDPNNVKWRQWKDESTCNVKNRPFLNNQFIAADVALVTIKIIDINLDPNSPIALNNRVSRIFVEYDFLNFFGSHQETAAVPKVIGSPIKFDHKQEFIITTKEAKLFSDMIRNQSFLQFNLVTQPERDPKNCQSCEEIAVAEINPFELVQSNEDTLKDSFPIIVESGLKIGSMTIQISGILSLRSLVLRVMSPNRYNSNLS